MRGTIILALSLIFMGLMEISYVLVAEARLNDMTKRLEQTRAESYDQKQELEKEIRLLETDIEVLNNVIVRGEYDGATSKK